MFGYTMSGDWGWCGGDETFDFMKWRFKFQGTFLNLPYPRTDPKAMRDSPSLCNMECEKFYVCEGKLIFQMHYCVKAISSLSTPSTCHTPTKTSFFLRPDPICIIC